MADLASRVELYRRGIVCPAEMWRMVADQLVGLDVSQSLGTLPIELQNVLRSCYQERALSLESLAADSQVYKSIEGWCLASNPATNT